MPIELARFTYNPIIILWNIAIVLGLPFNNTYKTF